MSVNIAVMASGSGSNFEEVARACADGTIDGKIVLLIYDRKAAYVRERAEKYGVPAEYINKSAFADESARDGYILERLQSVNAELVVLAGYLPKVGACIVDAYKNRVMNLHPSLIPAFCGVGFYGHHVHEAVLNYGARFSGATVHFVDFDMDTGPIILQDTVPVYFNDTPDTLAERVSHVEHRLLPEAVRLFCAGKLAVHGRRVEILS